ncbi:MAG TPA: NADH:flavin oxidoreductase, partial [Ilumatobacteraceae bacterium]|nr:NADH:flavin oxidoreductase [Ilumatobacteraceae bacterium]
MSERWTQVKKLDTVDAFRGHCTDLGVEIPIDDDVDPNGVLAEPITIVDTSAGTMTAPNRFAVLPMEGWDGTTDGRPTDLVRRRWQRFGASGSGLVWGEATAVRADGRANPNQLIIDERTVDEIAELRMLLDPTQLAGLQLTHAGRWS